MKLNTPQARPRLPAAEVLDIVALASPGELVAGGKAWMQSVVSRSAEGASLPPKKTCTGPQAAESLREAQAQDQREEDARRQARRARNGWPPQPGTYGNWHVYRVSPPRLDTESWSGDRSEVD